MKEFYPAPETDKGRYRYDLSVAVMANTDVEQVEKCLKSLNDAVPEELRCEYVLFNDGAGKKLQSISMILRIRMSRSLITSIEQTPRA